jgi:uncharacterized protein Yka (UPF0111/DUF47 family)
MNINQLFSFFLPKDKIFFDLFEKVANNVEEMGHLLNQISHESDYNIRTSLISGLEDLEHLNDDVTHQIFRELGQNFITPFDREDIHNLAISLDDICDYMWGSGKKINFYRIDPLDLGIQKMTTIIQEGSSVVKRAIYELRNMRQTEKISGAIIKIHAIENQADDVYDLCLEKLFEKEEDIKQLIKKRELFSALETVTDKFEQAANIMDTISVKYA